MTRPQSMVRYGIHEAVKASDGFYYCRCGFRRDRSYYLSAINDHIGRMRERAARVARA